MVAGWCWWCQSGVLAVVECEFSFCCWLDYSDQTTGTELRRKWPGWQDSRLCFCLQSPDQSQIDCWRDAQHCHLTSNWSIIKNFLRCLLLLKQQMCSWCEQSGPGPQAKVLLLLAGRWSDRNVKSPTQHMPTCHTHHKVGLLTSIILFHFLPPSTDLLMLSQRKITVSSSRGFGSS